MPGSVVFFVCIPTTNHEYHLLFNNKNHGVQEQHRKGRDSQLCNSNRIISLFTVDTDGGIPSKECESYSEKLQSRRSTIFNAVDNTSNNQSNMFISMEIVSPIEN